MIRDRMPNTTGDDMVTSGQWVKVGKSHYRHESGVEVRKDSQGWFGTDRPFVRWTALWVVRYEVEQRAARKVTPADDGPRWYKAEGVEA